MTSPTQRSVPRLPLRDGLAFRLSRVARTLRAQWAEALAPLQLSTAQAATLRAIADSPGQSLRALARTLATDPMNAKRCVDALERRGLLHSGHEGTPRRSRALRLTPEGQQLSDRVDRLAREQERRLGGWLGPEQVSGMRAALDRLEAALDLDVTPHRGDHR